MEPLLTGRYFTDLLDIVYSYSGGPADHIAGKFVFGSLVVAMKSKFLQQCHNICVYGDVIP